MTALPFASISRIMVPLVVAVALITGRLLAGSEGGSRATSATDRAAIELEAAWPGASGR